MTGIRFGWPRWFQHLTRERERCPWVAGQLDGQCVRNAGHRGLCETVASAHINTQTGRRVGGHTVTWYGINYVTEE